MQAVAVSNVPAGTDAAINEQISAAWIEIRQRVQKLAELSGNKVNPGLEIDDVLANLDAAQNPRKKSSKASTSVKETFSRTLGVIKTVGGIVSEGASQVFPPAGQCYNAISFVINAYQDYQSSFVTLAGLFEKCADFLDRLREYSHGGMNPKLSLVACQHLDLFVAICDRALELKSHRSKIKTFLKITFISENDADDLLVKMEGLVNKEELLVAAQTFRQASEANRNSKNALGLLTEGRAEKQERRQTEDDQNAILRVLAFNKTTETWDSARQQPIATWETRYNGIRKTVVPGTGKWVFSEPTYQSWADKNDDVPILGIVGGEATGKTFLASTVIQHLRRQGNLQDSDSRKLVGFSFLHRDENAGVDAFANSLIWQFANSDTSYMQAAATVCRNVGVLDPKDILPQLLLQNEGLDFIDATFYIIINKLGDKDDKIDYSVLEFLQKVWQLKSPSFRILITSTPGVMDHLATNGILCPRIAIDEKGEDDLRKFITTRMDRIDSLSDIKQVGVPKLRENIIDRLSHQTGGNYFKIDSALNEIDALDYMDGIELVLKNAGKELTDHIRADVKKLNRIRTQGELEEINEIILWITYAEERMSVEKMTGVLQLRSAAVPLRPLEVRFRTKFLLFEVDSDGYVDFRSSKTLRAIPERHQITAQNGENGEIIHPSEINVVQHFLNTVCPPDLLRKLELEQYFQQKLTGHKVQIHQEEKDTAHIRIAASSLRVLARKADARLTVLQGYAARQLVQHLSKVDLALVDRDLKSDLGPDLVKLFCFSAPIQNLFWSTKPIPAFPPWILEDRGMEEIKRWLGNSAVTSNLDENAKEWVSRLLDSGNNSFEVLLSPSAHRMAELAFRTPASPELTKEMFQFVLKFLSKVKSNGTTGVKTGSIEEPSLDQIYEGEKWSQTTLDFKTPDSLWEVQMAFILGDFAMDSAAECRCRHALRMDPSNWRASQTLARHVSSDQEAIQTLDELMERYENDTKWLEVNRRHFAEIAFDLGFRYWNVGKLGDAVKVWSKCIEHNPTHHQSTQHILYKYSASARWSDIVSLLYKIRNIDSSHLTGLAIDQASNEEFHETIRKTAIETGRFEILDQIYPDAIETASRGQFHEEAYLLRGYFAYYLSRIPNPPTHRVMEYLETAFKNDLPQMTSQIFEMVFLMSTRLGEIYYTRAKEANELGDRDLAMSYLQKLGDIVPEQLPEWQFPLPPRLFAARFYHVEGNDELAEHEARPSRQVALELLSDDDEGNDIFAFNQILFSSVAFGDEKNTAAALAIIAVSLNVWPAEEDEGPATSLDMECDDGCGHLWTEPGDMWFCKDCISTTLTSECLKKMKAGEFCQNACHPSHDHFYVPRFDPERMRKMPKGCVAWGDEDITLQQWTKEIRKMYPEYR